MMRKHSIKQQIKQYFRHCLIFLPILLCLLVLYQTSFAIEKRVALIIGNSNYPSSPLKNPVNDAQDIGIALEQLGFDTEVLLDQSRKEIRYKIREFGDKLNQADVGFFYYAGHGVQYQGTNFLVPVSADMQSEEEIVDEAISTSSILRKMEKAGNGVNIMVLDACRNNPFARSFRSGSVGLSVMDGPTGSYIAYATAPGSVAADGSGRNGLYTQYLLKNLDTPGLSIEQVFKRVRVAVVKDTSGQQVPWENSSLLGEFNFVEQLESTYKIVPIAKPKPPENNLYELEYWKLVNDQPKRSMFEAYLKKFPKGEFSSIAREKLKSYGHGTVTIISNVFGDSVKIDDEYRGTSKLQVSLTPGKHNIEVSKPGFSTIHQSVDVQAEKNILLQVMLLTTDDRSTTPVAVDTPSPPPLPVIVNEETDKSLEAKIVLLSASPSLTKTRKRSEPLIDMDFVKIPSGCFTMGSDFGEEGRLNDENEHKVCLSRDFWMSQYEVTQGQWQAVMGNNPSFFKGCGKNCPVERVSWNEVQGFLFKLNLKTGLSYRLPTEAEWEYTARAGTQTSVYTDNAQFEGENNVPVLDKIAWYSGNSGVDYIGGKYCEDWNEKQYPAKRCGTKPVGLKQANQWQVYDMIGNVWEWTQDRYGSHSSAEAHDPEGAAQGNQRVVKGGNWSDSLSQNRSASRYAFYQNTKHPHVGFRIVKVSE